MLGDASGFPSANNRIVDHSTPGARGGSGWGEGIWDHWPIGWLNLAGNESDWVAGSPYTYHFGSIGQFLVPNGKPLVSFWRDYSEYCKDMDFNRWTEQHVFYVLLGLGGQLGHHPSASAGLLDQGANCAPPRKHRQLEISQGRAHRSL